MNAAAPSGMTIRVPASEATLGPDAHQDQDEGKEPPWEDRDQLPDERVDEPGGFGDAGAHEARSPSPPPPVRAREVGHEDEKLNRGPLDLE